MTPDFDGGVVIRKGLASLAVREETRRRWGAVGRWMIGRGGAWRDERIIRETHDAGDSTPTSFSGA